VCTDGEEVRDEWVQGGSREIVKVWAEEKQAGWSMGGKGDKKEEGENKS